MSDDEAEPGAEGERTSTFLVTAADEQSAVLKDVTNGQVHTLSANPGVTVDEAVEGTVSPEPPLNVSWRLVDIERQWPLSLEVSDETPTAWARDVAADQPVGELSRKERAGEGEIHVVTVPDDGTDRAVEDVLDDREGTLARAARLGVARVEIRSEPGTVVVRYLP
jgi:hypothetical protein